MIYCNWVRVVSENAENSLIVSAIDWTDFTMFRNDRQVVDGEEVAREEVVRQEEAKEEVCTCPAGKGGKRKRKRKVTDGMTAEEKLERLRVMNKLRVEKCRKKQKEREHAEDELLMEQCNKCSHGDRNANPRDARPGTNGANGPRDARPGTSGANGQAGINREAGASGGRREGINPRSANISSGQRRIGTRYLVKLKKM